MRRSGEAAVRAALSAIAAAAVALSACGDPARDLVGRIESSMVTVPPGTFAMGVDGGPPDAGPAHEVTVTRPFALLRHEVTFDEYDAYCELSGASRPRDEGRGRGAMPVVDVSYADAARFCNYLSGAAGLRPCYDSNGFRSDASAGGYRLPTEAEWEYAARGAGSEAFDYAGSAAAGDVAWYGDLKAPRPVEGKAPNAIGAYDMSGNVWEWCNDWYDDDYYSRSPEADPPGSEYRDAAGGYGARRVRRGGNYHEAEIHATVWARSCDLPGQADPGIGFRIARTLE